MDPGFRRAAAVKAGGTTLEIWPRGWTGVVPSNRFAGIVKQGSVGFLFLASLGVGQIQVLWGRLIALACGAKNLDQISLVTKSAPARCGNLVP